MKKTLRITAAVLLATLLLIGALTGGLWLWGGASSSLASTLNQLASYLPAGQTLQTRDVEGSVRGGGRIGWLRWQSGQLSVEATDVRVAWTLRPLINGELRLSQLAIAHLRIEDQRAPSPASPPTDLRLPLRVDLPFQIDTVDWAGNTPLQIRQLRGHYVFDSNKHRLSAGQGQISSGNYRFDGELQAQAPMALALQLQGSVATTLPSSAQRVTVQAQADLKGTLAGPEAALALQARLQPEFSNASPAGKSAKATPQAMQASVTARLLPWQPQPIASANAQWQALDLAALWPQAPQTQLSGAASVTPAGAGWQGAVQLRNARSGPWNQQRLPLEQLTAQVVYQQGQWQVESLQASGAGGRIEAKGQLAAAQWQGSATLSGINPAALDTRLAATALDGKLTAQQTPSGIAFNAQLKPAARQPAARNTTALAGLRLQSLQTQGRWHAPLLTLDTLQLHTDDAQLQGQLSVDTRSLATQGQLALTLPGASATLNGHLASTRGQGDLSLRVSDASLSTRWLQRWPGLAAALNPTTLQGGAEVSAHWQGGWQQQGQTLQIQASVRAPQLTLTDATQTPEQAWRLRELQADLSGTLRALRLSVRGQADQAQRHFALQAEAQGGRLSDGVWQAQLDSAQLSSQSSLQPGLWTLQLSERLRLDWQQSASSQKLALSAASARLSGPVPGAATLRWQAANWSQQTTGTSPRTAWRSQGNVQGVPLAWLTLLDPAQTAPLGLGGDLLLGGQWDASGGDTLRLRATLERSSGDLQLQAEDASAPPLRAGLREARLQLNADGEQVSATLRWDSERAGQVQASASTRLQRQNGSWTWPADAPLAGSLRAQLPPINAWSVLAPPGWRLRGTLDADATLSGTRAAPLWRGTLQAQDIAVRSVVDGLDFSKGTLRARLEGQKLDILEFTLQGAGRDGGVLSSTGSVQWLPASGPAATAASRLRMELDATAKALRVSARADRRLVVSGQLSARLTEAHLDLRGQLKADSALFTLPDDTAPQLGDDVQVRKPGPRPVAVTAPAPARLRLTPEIAITLDLGPDFQVRGRGLVTRLAGQLELRNTAGTTLAPQLTGQLRTVRGTYKAYGQQLSIEQGLLRFTGPYDNPALDILAIRPNLQQRVGVQISGTARAPVVRLYAEPELAEADKLAWLILGRSAANGGAESALLQQAALALLGGNGKSLSGSLAQALGLDELSMRGASSDGTTTGATVMLGKHISRDFYVVFERSLTSTLGTLYIFYDLSRRFTLRAQAGTQSAVDLIFTVRYD